MDHSNAEAWFMKGNCHYHLGEFNDAIHCYEKTINIPQKHPKAFYNLAVTLTETGQYEEAVRFYDQCLAINPGFSTVITTRAVAFARLGRYGEAEVEFREAQDLDPRDMTAWTN
jgi:tetratricopeptide (TPR) repeat protein